MAKSGIITENGNQGDGTLAAALTEGDGVILTLGGVVAAGLAASSVKRLVAVDLVGRNVRFFPTGDGKLALFIAAMAGEAIATLTLRTEPPGWNEAAGSFEIVDTVDNPPVALAAVRSAIAPGYPGLSITALINRIEDRLADAGVGAVVVVDQESESVTVMSVDTDAQTEITAGAVGATLTEAAEVVQTLTESEGNPEFAFE